MKINLENVFQLYERECIIYFEAICINSSNVIINKSYKKLNLIYSFIKENNLRNELKKYLNSDYEGIKFYSAIHLLNVYPEEALITLNKLKEKQSSMICFDINMTISEWEKGNLIYLN